MRAKCTIVIEETDEGKLLIMGKVPDSAKGTIAATLAERLCMVAEEIMNGALGDKQTGKWQTEQ